MSDKGETVIFGSKKELKPPAITPRPARTVTRQYIRKLSHSEAKKLIDELLSFDALVKFINNSESLQAELLKRKMSPKGTNPKQNKSNKDRQTDTMRATLDIAKEQILERISEFYGKTT